MLANALGRALWLKAVYTGGVKWILAASVWTGVLAVGAVAGGAGDCPPAGDPVVAGEALTHGPYLGHVDHESARLWMRMSVAGAYVLSWETGSEALAVIPENDLCATFTLVDLAPQSEVVYTLRRAADEDVLLTGSLCTGPRPESGERVRLVFGSCANDLKRPQQEIWARIMEEAPDALVLLGDTPYIDSTELSIQRRRYREFFSQAQMAPVLKAVPTYATWDDHDFGRNDTDGLLAGKENSRQAFLEYHANPSAGEEGAGIFTSFRRGPVEVFLLDTRWFAGTEPSFADPDAPTLLGARQWAWLRRGLQASDAPFKLLACGMIWNGATRPGKTDHWGSYVHEREALFRWLGEQGISGVVLVGGDIHRTRVVRHAAAQLDGAGLVEWITSPLAYSVIKAANAPHPGLLYDGGLTDTCLVFDIEVAAQAARLLGRIIDPAGKVHFSLEQRAPLTGASGH